MFVVRRRRRETESSTVAPPSVLVVDQPDIEAVVKERDELELKVLAEFGDADIAEYTGAVFQIVWETLATVMGIDPE
jgi:hypothetical protein